MTQDVAFAARLVATEGTPVELNEDVVAVCVQLNVLRQVLSRTELPLAQFAEELFEVKAHRQLGHFGSHAPRAHGCPT